MANVLIVDDEEMDRLLERALVEDAGHTPFFANDGEAAMKVYEENDIDIVITDLRMPKLDGLRLIQNLLEKDPNAAIIAVSGAASDQLAKAEEYGAIAALIKPVKPEELMDTLQEVAANLSKEQDLGEGDLGVGDLWGGPDAF